MLFGTIRCDQGRSKSCPAISDLRHWIDFEKLKTLSDDDILCIIPTHLFGIPSDVGRIRDICEAKGIYILEDAAQALGVTVGGRKAGTLGDVGFFSLGRGKNITSGSGSHRRLFPGY
jgi:dTDP-4-amino-4,6-dideoxygalactose transaminase